MVACLPLIYLPDIYKMVVTPVETPANDTISTEFIRRWLLDEQNKRDAITKYSTDDRLEARPVTTAFDSNTLKCYHSKKLGHKRHQYWILNVGRQKCKFREKLVKNDNSQTLADGCSWLRTW